MATVQQLEKLYHVRRLFHVEDSLEAAVAGERVKLMIEKTEQLIRQRAFLREERRYLRTTAEALEEYKLGVNSLKSDKWIPSELKLLPSRCIQINVGGLVSIRRARIDATYTSKWALARWHSLITRSHPKALTLTSHTLLSLLCCSLYYLRSEDV